jgi:hypothetical protein
LIGPGGQDLLGRVMRRGLVFIQQLLDLIGILLAQQPLLDGLDLPNRSDQRK